MGEGTPHVDGLLLLAPGCPHCQTVARGLWQLVEEGELGRLEVVNAAARPIEAASRGVFSFPTVFIGPFLLEGALTTHQLRQWVATASDRRGMAVYFDHLFSAGKRLLVERMVRANPEYLAAFAQLLGDPQVGINTRLGIGVVLESLQGSGLARGIVHQLGLLTGHPDARIRGDACHYMSLTESKEAMAFLASCLQDENKDVREIAQESLDVLAEE